MSAVLHILAGVLFAGAGLFAVSVTVSTIIGGWQRIGVVCRVMVRGR